MLLERRAYIYIYKNEARVYITAKGKRDGKKKEKERDTWAHKYKRKEEFEHKDI